NNEGLQYDPQIFRHIVCEDVYKQSGSDQRTKQNCREQYAKWMIPSEQRNRNPGEAIIRREVVIIPIAITENIVYPNQPRQHSRNEHRYDHVPRDRDSAILRSGWIGSNRAQLVSPFRLPKKHINYRASREREQKRQVQGQSIRETYSQRSQHRAHPRDVRSDDGPIHFLGYRQSLQNRIALLAIVILSQIADQASGYEIHHDRRDDFMSSKPRFENARYPSPHAAYDDIRYHRQQSYPQTRPTWKHQPNPGSRESSGD